MKFFLIFFLTFFGSLYPIVLVKGSVDSKYIFIFSEINYTVEITGVVNSFVFDSFDPKYINDFEIVDEKIVDTVTKRENEATMVSKRIVYKLKPLAKGKLIIPESEVKYFSVENNGVLKAETKRVNAINISVVSLSFILVILFLIVVAFAVIFKIIYEEKKIRRIKKQKENLYNKINMKFRKD